MAYKPLRTIPEIEIVWRECESEALVLIRSTTGYCITRFSLQSRDVADLMKIRVISRTRCIVWSKTYSSRVRQRGWSGHCIIRVSGEYFTQPSIRS